MSFLCTPINPLYRERCIASSAHGDVCQESIDFTTRGFAHRELVLSEQESRSEVRATNLRNAARLMICDNHKNRSQEARRIARLWEELAAIQRYHTFPRQHRNPDIQAVSTIADIFRRWNYVPVIGI
ncbi:hypothetical protein BDW62DRAFT_194274 [Aspergillus aurantiobrunneus]